MKKRILSILLTATILLSACGATETASNQSAIVENTNPSENIVDNGQDRNVPEVEHIDTDIRGNSTGNLANLGMACDIDDDEFVFYTPYDGNIGVYKRSTGSSKLVFPSVLFYMNVYDGFLYGITTDSAKSKYILIKQNLKNRHCEFLREDNVVSLSVVNGVLYYTDIEGKLYSRSIDTNEEKLLIDKGVVSENIYKNKIYYADSANNNNLYVADIDGANKKCIYAEPVKNLVLYEDYVYFSSGNSLMRMAVDEIETFTLEEGVSISCINIANDTLYYVNQNDLECINYIDLNGDLESQKIDFMNGLLSYYHNCEGEGQNVKITAYNGMNISGNYMYLEAYFDVDGNPQMAEFCYDLSNYTIPVVKSQPNERFDFDNMDAQILTWYLADNTSVYENVTGNHININYTQESADELKKLAESDEYLTVDKIETPPPGKANVDNFDPQTVQAAIYALQGEYPEGRPWGMGDYRDFNGGFYCGGYACAAFAFMASDAVFGTLPARQIFDVNEARVGDIITTFSPTSHAMVVLAINEDSITVCEGNYNGTIHWGRTISKGEIQAGLAGIFTRYP